MPAAAEFPSEILATVLHHLTDAPEHEVQSREDKRLLLGPSQVCAYWSEMIRPALFRSICLTSLPDIFFLRGIIDSPLFPISSLYNAIEDIFVLRVVTDNKAWMHHIHWLSMRLPKTIFSYELSSDTDAQDAPISPSTSLLNTLPRTLPPTCLRLTHLHISGLQLTDTTEFARFVDRFPTLETCITDDIVFVDTSQVVQSRRVRRRPWSPLTTCEISGSQGMTIAAEAALACDILTTSVRPSVVDASDTRDKLLDALAALAPGASGGVCVNTKPAGMLPRNTVLVSFRSPVQADCPLVTVEAGIWMSQSNENTGAAPQQARIQGMELDIWFSDPDIEVESLPWDALEPLLDPAHAKFLCFTVAPGGQYHSVKRLMCAVLRRTRLAWALNRGLLHFCKHRHPDRRPLSSLSCADINVVPAEHAVDGHALTLDTEEQAEWLLRIFQGSGRDAYLRELVAARMVDGGGGGESPRDELVLASRMSGRAAGN